MDCEIQVDGVEVTVVRKAIRNLHFRVYPPDGRVRVSVPRSIGDRALRDAVARHMGWIRRQQAQIAAAPPPPASRIETGEEHLLFGTGHRLTVVHHAGRPDVSLNDDGLIMRIRPDCGIRHRQELLRRWYRARLMETVPPLLARWQAVMGVSAGGFVLRRMKSRWGTCNIQARRICLNIELARRPPECLEYVIVHELAHLIRRPHDARFRAVMDTHLPDWRQRRAKLNGKQPVRIPHSRLSGSALLQFAA